MVTRNILASRIGELDSEDLEIRKPTLPSFSAKSVITEFVGDRSRLLFDLLGVQTGFLLSPDWQMTPEYDTVKTALKNLSPLNDSSERALALAIRLNTKITRDIPGTGASGRSASKGVQARHEERSEEFVLDLYCSIIKHNKMLCFNSVI